METVGLAAGVWIAMSRSGGPDPEWWGEEKEGTRVGGCKCIFVKAGGILSGSC